MTDNPRGCYCGLWEKEPEYLKRQGVPEGFCGFCDTCKKPGHTRHFPGSSPVTGCWCDVHYRRVALFHPLGVYGKRLWSCALLILVLLWLFLPGWLK